MNDARRKALDEWWYTHQDKHFTAAAIWDAACDWMKAEIVKELEAWVDEKESGDERPQG